MEGKFDKKLYGNHETMLFERTETLALHDVFQAFVVQTAIESILLSIPPALKLQKARNLSLFR